ncbi:hypothetical protein SAMN05444359_109127 [Neolewinella agarilytica]|uniref:Uncharacterized protein n=2 Tax=Neolewinella agarilytica TaxID=478744 RepID=A0A1H9FWJ0_9BACT|nr:hypothetical protein SAMN05444359_109127 [Neolewinella agarilytica]
MIEVIDGRGMLKTGIKQSRQRLNRVIMKMTSTFEQFVTAKINNDVLSKISGGISQEDFDAVMAHLFVNNRAQYEIVKQMAQDGMINIE